MGNKYRGEKRGSITYGTDQANEVNKMFIISMQKGCLVTFAGPYCKLWTGKLTNQSSRAMQPYNKMKIANLTVMVFHVMGSIILFCLVS